MGYIMSEKKAAEKKNHAKHSRGNLKWVWLAVAGVVVVAGISLGVLYVAGQLFGESRETKQAKEDFAAMNLAIDPSDTIVLYTEKLNADDKQAAIDAYKKAFNTGDSNETKLKLASDIWNVARERSEYGHMLVTARDKVSVDPSLENYDILIASYTTNGDYVGATQAAEKALVRFDEVNPAPLNEEAQGMRQIYQGKISSFKSLQVTPKEES